MTSSLDLNLLPLQRQDGKESQTFPGLYMATPPRRAARSRTSDLLVIYCNISGNAPFEPQQEEQLLTRLAQLYYKTPGSVTAAMKATADSLNLSLLERNLRSTSSGQQTLGMLTIAVLKNERLILTQAGPVHAFLIKSDRVDLLYDPQIAKRSLGLTRSAAVRFFQSELQSNDLLIVTPNPPPGWTMDMFQHIHGQSLDSLRRKLLSQAGANVEALIACALHGTGKIRLLKPRPPVQMVQGQEPAGAPAAVEPEDVPSPPSAVADIPTPDVMDTDVAATPAGSPGHVEAETERTSIEAASIEEKEQREVERPGELPSAEPERDSGSMADVSYIKDEVTSSTIGEAKPKEIEQKENHPPAMSPTRQETLEDELDFLMPIEDHQAPAVEIQPSREPQGKERRDARMPQTTSSGLGEVHPTSTGLRRTPSPGKETGVQIGPQGQPPQTAKRSLFKRKKTALDDGAQRAAIAQSLLSPLRKAGSAVKAGLVFILQKFAAALVGLLKRILPDESMFTIPASTMAFTAVAVALVIAIAGSVVYFQQGYEAQYYGYYEQALEASAMVNEYTDPIEIRTAWDTTLFYLDRAESYKTTIDSMTLRSQAQRALDSFDYIYRMNYQEAIAGSLGGSVQITHLAATANELFFYNASGGNVLRAVQTGRGYEIDPDFKCSTNPSFGPIIDLQSGMRTDTIRASVIAMDSNGNLMYCNQGESPKMTSPAPPQIGWGSPAAFTIDNNTLYILDPQANAVWFYRGMDLTNPPHLYFDDQIPNLQTAVALAVNGDDLYILHGDGQLTTCKYRSFQVSRTRCESPVNYSDPRPGRHSGPQILDAQFKQILYTSPPDPSIYLLDPINQSVYHFSVRMNLQRQFRPMNALSGDTATAFAISPNRTVFLASGSQIYYAVLP
jgi:hypothetical protein